MAPRQHPFHTRPHRTVLWLTAPAFLSLIAEPLTAAVDTAFVSQLGKESLAALGAATTVLSSIFWIFNFLGVGIHTEVACSHGAEDKAHAQRMLGLASAMAWAIGMVLLLVAWPLAEPIARLMGAITDDVVRPTVVYLRIRLLGGPPMLWLLVLFGALRGIHDMTTPLKIAIGFNLLNIGLDPLLIFGWGGFFPAFGVAGAAWATVLSQWLGAGIAFVAVRRSIGFSRRWSWSDAGKLLSIGRDMFVRTGMMLLFLLLSTRAALRMGTGEGAAHHVMRQTWGLAAMALDAFAAAAQSLVGYAVGNRDRAMARKAGAVSLLWGGLCGVLIALLYWASTLFIVETFFQEAGVAAIFMTAWWLAIVSQPLNAVAFVTDGVHWGTSDYPYLRNVSLFASGSSCLAVMLLDVTASNAFVWLWAIAVFWVSLRALLGVLRVWPGLGAAPLRRRV